MGKLISLEERRRWEVDRRLLAVLAPEQREAVLWALENYPALTVAKAIEILERAGGI